MIHYAWLILHYDNHCNEVDMEKLIKKKALKWGHYTGIVSLIEKFSRAQWPSMQVCAVAAHYGDEIAGLLIGVCLGLFEIFKL